MFRNVAGMALSVSRGVVADWRAGASDSLFMEYRPVFAAWEVFIRMPNDDEGLIVAYSGGAKEIDCDA
jgi:hypothetical protein